MSLYTKYRPKDWNSVIGQDYITTILKNSLASGRISHAYLFHGSRGTGKTTSARILAKGVNCLDLRDGNPCHECAHCRAFDDGTMLDVIEIDAASNTGVENIRDLIEKSRFEPNQGKYKIYIIDEVHMLSTGAFNALLKTLEEPPEHVKFILATTETEKVPETIRSRTLRFDFRKIGMADILTRLDVVCKAENITAESEALQIIAKAARGGLRDALTLLEQNLIDSEIRTEHVRYTLALIDEVLIDTIIEHLRTKNTPEILNLIEHLREKHVQARSFFEQLMYRLRDLMIEHLSDEQFFAYESIFREIESAYTRVRSIPDGMMLIEITLLVIAKGKHEEKSGTPSLSPNTSNKTISVSPKTEKTSPIESMKDMVSEEAISVPNPPTIPLSDQLTTLLPDHSPAQPSHHPTNGPTDHPTTSFSFPLLLNHIKEHVPGLFSDLKMAKFRTEGTTLTLSFSSQWNYDRVSVPLKKNSIAEGLTKLFGGKWNILTELSGSTPNLAHHIDEVF